jgi:hypothetical protein
MNKLVVAVGVAALAIGCGKKKKEEPKPTTPPPAAAVDAAAAVAPTEVIDAAPPPLTPAIPAGKIGIQINDLEYGGFQSPGLPAIKSDGSQFIAVVVADDGGRGYLDLQLRLIDATNAKVVKDWVLADPDKTSGSQDSEEENPTPAVLEAAKSAVAEANTMLGAGEWRSLAPVVSDRKANDGGEGPTVVNVGDLTFTYDKGKLTVGKQGVKPIVKTYQQLTGEPPPKVGPKDADDECDASGGEWLKSVSVDATSKRALIEFDFDSGHNCGTGVLDARSSVASAAE